MFPNIEVNANSERLGRVFGGDGQAPSEPVDAFPGLADGGSMADELPLSER